MLNSLGNSAVGYYKQVSNPYFTSRKSPAAIVEMAFLVRMGTLFVIGHRQRSTLRVRNTPGMQSTRQMKDFHQAVIVDLGNN